MTAQQIKVLNKAEMLQFGRFLLAGAFSAVCNFFSRFFFQLYCSYVLSVVCAFIVGTLLSFFLNRHFTFRTGAAAAGPQVLRFTLVALLSVVLAAIVVSIGMWSYKALNISAVSLPQAESLVHLGAIGVNLLYNYLMMRYFAFR